MHRLAANGIALGLAALLTACASTSILESQTKPQSPQQARIYILRDTQFMTELVHPGIKVDEQKVGALGPGRYMFVDRDPGQHVVAVYAETWVDYYPVTVSTRPGSVHYLQVELRPLVQRVLTGGLIPQAIEQASTGHSGGYKIEELNSSAGQQLLQRLKAGSG